MKNIVKATVLLAALALSFSSCIKEAFPMDSIATSEQVSGSASSLDAAVCGLPAQMTQSYLIYGDQVTELDYGYPSMMMIFSQLLGDLLPVGDDGYDHYYYYNACVGCGPTTYRAFVPWRTFYMFVKGANDIIGAVDVENSNASQLGVLGMAYAYRAFSYYNLMNMYEPVANEYTDCSKVLGLTVPIVSDKTTPEEGKNNPRATHADMVKFIISDLDEAEKYLKDYKPASKSYPSLAVVYGLKAKTYVSDNQWANAEKYARLAIDESGCTPLTEAQWNEGFNKANSAWMWCTTYSAESMGNLANWMGWISGEADWGYGKLIIPGIDRSLYDSIGEDDFRKHSWIDPKKFNYYEGYTSCRGNEWIEKAPDYASLKFRPVGGDYQTYTVGGLADVPMMRVEEMYYIEAEAKGMQNLSDGIAALNSFVQTYRQPSYNCTLSTEAGFEREIVRQKKVEFWGEGIAFFDAKRIGYGCKMSYEGTNAPTDEYKLNCNVCKPNWNFVIPNQEMQNNTALEGLNNPDPSGMVKPTL